MMKTLSIDQNRTYKQMVALALLVYNNNPHGSLGNTPHLCVFIIDCVVPVFKELVANNGYRIHMLLLTDRWVGFYDKKEESLNVSHDTNFEVGNLGTYNLSDKEKQKYKHESRCNQ